MKKFISWRRVSTKRQGKSGLGLAAQKDIIEYFVKAEKGELIKDYCEVYTGTDLAGCTELQKAIAHTERENAILIIARSDRFRSTIEALQVLEDVGEQNIMFCDLPHTDKFTLTLAFAISEREALQIRIRTKAALNEKRKRGEKMGGACRKCDINPILNKARKVSAQNRRIVARQNPANKAFWEFMEDWQTMYGKVSENTDFKAIADKLNERGKTTSTGLPFNKNRAKAMFTSMQRIYSNN